VRRQEPLVKTAFQHLFRQAGHAFSVKARAGVADKVIAVNNDVGNIVGDARVGRGLRGHENSELFRMKHRIEALIDGLDRFGVLTVLDGGDGDFGGHCVLHGLRIAELEPGVKRKEAFFLAPLIFFCVSRRSRRRG